MTDRIKSAFGAIHAEDSLKDATLQCLHERMEKKVQPRRYFGSKRLVASVVCLFFVVLAGAFSYNLYYTEAAYIDLDINPSVELIVNRFDRVIGTSAYNADGEVLLSGLTLQHKKVDVALNEIIRATEQAGVLQNEGLVSVTVQSLYGDETRLLSGIQAEVTASVSHHDAVQVDIFSVDSGIRNAAHDQHISPAKYLAILELQAVDPTASIDGCRGHTIGEIRQLTQEHGRGHHGEPSDGQNDVDIGENDTDGNEDENSDSSNHHGNGHSGRGHK